MANTVGDDRLSLTPWTTDMRLELPAAIPAANITFYSGQAMGRDASGNIVQMDDTAAAEFIGILDNLPRVTVPTDATIQANGLQGDFMFRVERPLAFKAKIAAAVAGQEGKKVFWKYNNEVQYVTGTFGNFAGTVLHVINATRVLVLPPWMRLNNSSPHPGTLSLAATGTVTLTKFAINKIINFIDTAADQVVNLPLVTTLSPGDEYIVINTVGTRKAVFTPNGTDLINGANSVFNGSVTQWAKNVLTVIDLAGVLQWQAS